MKRMIFPEWAVLLIFSLFCAFSLVSCHTDHPFHHDDDDDDIGNNSYYASDPFSISVGAGDQTSIRIEAINGPIEVVGVAGLHTVEISGERIVHASSTRDANQNLDNLQVNLSDLGNALVVRTDQPDASHGRNYEVRYYVRVPRNWNVFINLVRGSVDVDSINADVNINLTDGSAELTEIFGGVKIDLVNGNISAQMELPPNENCNLSSVNGLIELHIPQNTSAGFQATVVNGQIVLNGLSLTNSSTSTRSMHGTLGRGEGSINLSTVNGSIRAYGY